jgi:lipoprotein Spr
MKFLKYIFLSLSLFLLASCSISKKSAQVKPESSANTIKESPIPPIPSYQGYSEKLGFEVDENCNVRLMEESVNWLGVPYKYGGTTKEGVDCSGLTGELYKAVFNKAIPRVSKDIYEKSEQIEKQNLCEGDIVYFYLEGKNESHIGVYLKNNKFIHASTKKGVIISDLDEEYYKKTFCGAGRIK